MRRINNIVYVFLYVLVIKMYWKPFLNVTRAQHRDGYDLMIMTMIYQLALNRLPSHMLETSKYNNDVNIPSA